MIKNIKLAFKNTFDFHGRAPRAEYLWFQICGIIIEVLAYTVCDDDHELGYVFILLLSGIPSQSLQKRGFYDLGFPGWVSWLLVIFVFFYVLFINIYTLKLRTEDKLSALEIENNIMEGSLFSMKDSALMDAIHIAFWGLFIVSV